jgi:hypothetical protein
MEPSVQSSLCYRRILATTVTQIRVSEVDDVSLAKVWTRVCNRRRLWGTLSKSGLFPVSQTMGETNECPEPSVRISCSNSDARIVLYCPDLVIARLFTLVLFMKMDDL